MNYFIEGLQGSGKSTLANRLSQKHPDYTALREGDYSPVELAWCAYLSMEDYELLIEKYRSLTRAILAQTYIEDDRKIVVCYTRIGADTPEFYKDYEKHEIYNNRMTPDEFRRIILSRYERWKGDKNIFECSLFQNIVEDMILFQNASDQEIIDFYKEIARALKGKRLHILYLETKDIAANIDIIRKERTDENGNEKWFPAMLDFFDNSPYALSHDLSGTDAMLEHFRHRQELELKICREVFPGKYTVLQSKEYTDGEF